MRSDSTDRRRPIQRSRGIRNKVQSGVQVGDGWTSVAVLDYLLHTQTHIHQVNPLPGQGERIPLALTKLDIQKVVYRSLVLNIGGVRALLQPAVLEWELFR